MPQSRPQQNNLAYPTVAPPNLGYPTSADAQQKPNNANPDSGFLDNFSKLKGDDERQGFVTKVFGILAFQMAITTLFVYFIISDKDRLKFVKENIWVYVLCFIASIGIMYTLLCFRDIARKVPTNYILL